MRPIGFRSAILFVLGAAAATASAGLAGCGGVAGLLPATFENTVDTLTIWAATGTAVYRPSGYLISQPHSVVRLDLSPSFDFLYNITPDGEHVFLPIGALANTGRTSGNPGLLATTTPFDSISVAQQTDYVTADTVRIHLGDVFFARSAPNPNCILGIPYYAKLQILGIDDSARAIGFRVLANINCGYRSLETGIPKK